MRIVLITLFFLLAGCGVDRVSIVDGAIQNGAALYPSGSELSTLDLPPSPKLKQFIIADLTLEDGFAAAVLARANPATQPACCFRFERVCFRRASNPMSFGMDRDYVLVDNQDRVVFAARRRLD